MAVYKESLLKIISGADLSEQEAHALMLEILNGEHGPERIAGLLTALLAKGESLTEVKGFVQAMRKMAVKLNSEARLVDTCGTGGDGSNTFNISTTTAFVAAGAGIPIAKHHNRAVSSRSGSADLLEALDIDIQMPLDVVERCVNEMGIGFCFAPLFHPSMKHAAPARKELGIRTVFNILGPLLNPFAAKRQVIGIFSPDKMRFMAELLSSLGSEKVLVVHGSDGLDEATLTGPSYVVELSDGWITEYELDPREYGFNICDPGALTGGDARRNAEITREILAGAKGPATDIVILNAALAIYAGRDDIDMKKAVEMAGESVFSGSALEKMNLLVALSKKTGTA